VHLEHFQQRGESVPVEIFEPSSQSAVFAEAAR